MASGWWDNDGSISGCVAAYQPVGAADLAASYVNLQNPGTYNAAPGTAPSFNTSTGWTFNGTTMYLTTGYSPAGSTNTILVRFSGAVNSGNRALIAAGSSGNIGIFSALGGVAQVANFGLRSLGSFYSSGVLGVAGGQGYYNGSAVGATFSTGTDTYPALQIGCYTTGSRSMYYNGTIEAFAIYSATLSGAEMATLTTRMNALPVASGSPLPLFAAQMMAMR